MCTPRYLISVNHGRNAPERERRRWHMTLLRWPIRIFVILLIDSCLKTHISSSSFKPCFMYSVIFELTSLYVFIRLKARLQPNIGFTLLNWLWCVHAFGYNSAEIEPIWMKYGALWLHCRKLALADFGRDPRGSDNWRARRNFVVFCQARFHWFPAGQM